MPWSQVSWIRNEDRYLTAGLFTMTVDDRFTPSVEDSNVWQLRIRDVRPEDSGAYGCQVSARTPMVKTVWLTVAGEGGGLEGGPERDSRQKGRNRNFRELHVAGLPETIFLLACTWNQTVSFVSLFRCSNS